MITRKALTIVAALLATLSLAGCTTKSSTKENTNSNNSVNKNYVKTGKMTKPGQYTKNADLGKATLMAIGNTKNYVNQKNDVKTTVESVKIIKIHPLKDSQKSSGNEMFMMKGIDSGYSYVQLDYRVENNSNSEIQVGGSDRFVFTNKNQISIDDDGVMDNGSGESLVANAKKEYETKILLQSKTTGLNPKNITVYFTGSANSKNMDNMTDDFTYNSKIRY